jgi:hypothetical protein
MGGNLLHLTSGPASRQRQATQRRERGKRQNADNSIPKKNDSRSTDAISTDPDSLRATDSCKNGCDNYHLVILYITMKEKRSSREDETLVGLLNLDGEIFPMDNGYWTKFEVWRVDPEPHVPHGVRYSLTLHDRYNRRVLGFDNAHAIRPARKGYAARKITWDHLHKCEKISPYDYETASRLLEDFWREVERIMGEK